MPERQQQAAYSSVAPPHDITAVEMETVQQRVEVIRHHFEGQRIAGVHTLAMSPAVHRDDPVMFGEIRDLVGKDVDRSAIDVQQQERGAPTVGLIIKPDTPGGEIMAGRLVVPVDYLRPGVDVTAA